MNLIWCDVKDPERFQRVMGFLEEDRSEAAVQRCAREMAMTVGAVRAVKRKAEKLRDFKILLERRGGGERIPVGVFRSSKGFVAACEKAVRVYSGTLKNLGLGDWELSDGKDRQKLLDLICKDGGDR